MLIENAHEGPFHANCSRKEDQPTIRHGKAMKELSLPSRSQGQFGRSATASALWKSVLYPAVSVIILAYIARMKRRHGSHGDGERKPKQREILRLIIPEPSFNV